MSPFLSKRPNQSTDVLDLEQNTTLRIPPAAHVRDDCEILATTDRASTSAVTMSSAAPDSNHLIEVTLVSLEQGTGIVMGRLEIPYDTDFHKFRNVVKGRLNSGPDNQRHVYRCMRTIITNETVDETNWPVIRDGGHVKVVVDSPSVWPVVISWAALIITIGILAAGLFFLAR